MDNKSKFSVGEGPINQLATLDELAYHVSSLSNISSNSDSTLVNPTDQPSNSSSHTMAIHTEINEQDEKNDTHINVITSLTTRSPYDRCVLDSGANRHIFMDDSWPETPTVANIYGISVPIPATKQCVIGH